MNVFLVLLQKVIRISAKIALIAKGVELAVMNRFHVIVQRRLLTAFIFAVFASKPFLFFVLHFHVNLQHGFIRGFIAAHRTAEFVLVKIGLVVLQSGHVFGLKVAQMAPKFVLQMGDFLVGFEGPQMLVRFAAFLAFKLARILLVGLAPMQR